MPMTKPKHRPGRDTTPQALPNRRADKHGQTAGLSWQAWHITRGTRGEWHVVIYDGDTRIDAHTRRSGPAYPLRRRSTRPYHLVQETSEIPVLCREIAHRRRVPRSCGRRDWQKEGDTPARLDIASRYAHDRLRDKRREPETHHERIVTDYTKDGEHTALAHEI